jgi:enoyl-CoA hydratase/carnithine racemase
MSAQLRSETVGQTMVLTLRDETGRNMLGPAVYAAGVEALNAASDNPEIRSVVITGEGSVFSAGGDLDRLQRNRNLPPEIQAASIDGLHLWIEELSVFPKPVIAAVEGAAAGAGFSLALACDLIVAAQNAVFRMSYGLVGLSPDGGASWQLTRLVPRALAAEWLMLGDRIPVDRLRELGVVNKVVAAGLARSAALETAARLNLMAPNVVASLKELLVSGERSTLCEQLVSERDHFVRNLFHANAGIGISAFRTKQAPEFK